MKSIDFHPRTLEFIQAQSQAIRSRIGEALRDLQKGVNLGMPLSRPMPVVAPGVCELRMRLARRRLKEVINAKIES